MYTELLETSRQYVCGLTPAPCLPVLLLTAQQVDCDAAAQRFVVDGWLLLRVHDGSGPAVLAMVCRLRAAVERLLAQRLRAARLQGLSGHAAAAAAVAMAAAAADRRAVADDRAAQPEAPGRSGLMAVLQQALEAASLEGAKRPEPAALLAVSAGDTDPDDCVTAASAVDEDDVARCLALAMQWPVRFSVAALSGQRLTAQYELPTKVEAAPPFTGSGEAPAAAVAAGGGAPASSVEVTRQGVPRRRAGVSLATWLRFGSLRSFESGLALHSLQPYMRRHWQCPGCAAKLVAGYDEVVAHIAGCSLAQALPRRVVESTGYKGPSAPQQVVDDGSGQVVAAAAGDESGGDKAGAGEASRADDPQLGALAEVAVQMSLAGLPTTFGTAHEAAALSVGVTGAAAGFTAAGAGVAGQAAGVLALLQRHGVSVPATIAEHMDKLVSWGRRSAATGQDCVTGFDPNEEAHGRRNQDAADLGMGSARASSRTEAASTTQLMFRCQVCGLEAALTPVQVLQHNWSHAAGGVDRR